MKTLVDYRHRTAQMLDLYRWNCRFYGSKSNIEYCVFTHIRACYMQICAMNQMGIISNDCKTRAYYMYAKIRDKYYRGVHNGCIK